MMKKQSGKKVPCRHCGKEISGWNMSHHLKNAHENLSTNKNKLFLEAFTLIQSNEELVKENLLQKQKIHDLERENIKLTQILSQINVQLQTVTGCNFQGINFCSIIENEFQNTQSKGDYMREWKFYEKWCNGKNPLQAENANEYLRSCKPTSTIHKKRGKLNSLLQIMNNNSTLKLRKVHQSIATKPKYKLSDEELIAFLNEQKSIDPQDYALFFFLFYFCARVNSAIHFKWKHTDLGTDYVNQVLVTDTKNRFPKPKEMKLPVDETFWEFIKEHKSNCTNSEDPDGYVFYPEISKNRVSYITAIVNGKISESKVMEPLINKNPDKKFTSHLFRKTKSYDQFYPLMKQAYAAARKVLRHSEKSQAVRSYIIN
jgi:integrase